MDLIYTNANRADQGVLSAYAFDLSFGADENDFEIILGENEPVLDFGTFVYIEGTEYGGRIDGIKASTASDTITYVGKTWHGLLNTKVVEPDPGEAYLKMSGDANAVMAALITRLNLGGLFSASESLSNITVNHQFRRYDKAYDAIAHMLSNNNAKLKIVWQDSRACLYAVPIVDYTNSMVDNDTATLTVERYSNKVNHMICLGRGELAEREVIHLYVDRSGRIGDTQAYFDLEEVTDVYENTSAETSDDLRDGGISRLRELWNMDVADISVPESYDLEYDIGDILGATEIRSGITVTTKVSQKIVRIKNGAISTEYQTGG